MASLAARAERQALAAQAVEEAMVKLAAAHGVDAPQLPTHRDPAVEHTLRLEAVAAFLSSLVAPEPEPETEKEPARKRKG